MWTRFSIAITALLAVAACGGGSSAGNAENSNGGAGGNDEGNAMASAASIDCPPLTVTIGGEAVTGLDHAFAYSEPETGPGTGGFGVEVFNHAEASCEDILTGSRGVPAGEVNVRAFVREGSSMGTVAVGSKSNMTPGIELASTAANEGDLVAICVTDATWTSGGFGDDAGKTYAISGLFAAPYCGERQAGS